MLKYAIDVYNLLLDILDFIKKPSLTYKSAIFAAGTVIAVTISLVSVQAFGGSSADEQARQASDTQASSLSEQAGNSQKTADKTSASSADKKETPTSAESSNGHAAAGSDAAVSTEPTASRSFRLPAVTKAGQYEPGTLIAYDATKDDKTYYAGDLAFSVGSVTISKSNSGATVGALKVGSPDGANISVPAEPTEGTSPYFTISLDAASQPAEGPANSYGMIVGLKGSVDPGTYQLHVVASRSAQASGSWWYHGFLTVKVEE